MAGTRIAGVRRRNEPGPGPTMNGVTIQAESHGSQFDARHAKGACDARRASGTSATGRRQASCGWAGPADARGARHRSRERPDQGRSRALLRPGRAADETVSEGPAGLAGARAVGHRRGPVFQRHMDAAMPGARLLPESLYPGHPPLLELPTPRAVLAAVQMNAIEFHTWNAVKTAIDKPDRIVFDLDPGEGVPWENVGQAAGAARVVERDRAGRVAQDQRRQGPACAGATAQAAWLGNHEGFFSGPGAASGAGLAAVVRGQERSAQPGGQDLRGLPAQRLWRDDRGALVGAGAGLPISVPISWDELEQVRGGALDHRGRAGAMDIGNRPWDGYAPQAWARPWRRLVRVRREGAPEARGRRQAGPRQGASDFFIEGAGCRT